MMNGHELIVSNACRRMKLYVRVSWSGLQTWSQFGNANMHFERK